MSVKIRLMRQGMKKRPEYLIIATDSEGKRDGAYLDRIGYYYPKAKTTQEKVKLNKEKLNLWLGRGGQMSETVGQLVKLASE